MRRAILLPTNISKLLDINDLGGPETRKPLIVKHLRTKCLKCKKKLVLSAQSVILIGMTIRNFNDLVFNNHANNPDGIQAIMSLGNDLSISVVSMKQKGTQYGGLYGDASNGTYEVVVFHNDSMLPLSPFDDVLGWQTEDDLNELMVSLQGRQADIAGAIAQMYNDRADARADLELDNNHQN